MSFFTGTPGSYEKVSRFRPGAQESLAQQSVNAGLQRGAGGAFGTSADYYRDVLSNDSEDFNAFARPELRRFREETIPGLSEQFAGFGGSGSLDSSGFRNAAVNAGTDLSERLGAIRAQLRQQAAQGLMGIGQQGLGQFDENIYRERTPGFLETAAPAIGAGLGMFGGPALGALGNQIGDWISQRAKRPSATDEYDMGRAAQTMGRRI